MTLRGRATLHDAGAAMGDEGLDPGPCHLAGQRSPVRNIESDHAYVQAIALVAREAAARIGDAARSSSVLFSPEMRDHRAER